MSIECVDVYVYNKYQAICEFTPVLVSKLLYVTNAMMQLHTTNDENAVTT